MKVAKKDNLQVKSRAATPARACHSYFTPPALVLSVAILSPYYCFDIMCFVVLRSPHQQQRSRRTPPADCPSPSCPHFPTPANTTTILAPHIIPAPCGRVSQNGTSTVDGTISCPGSTQPTVSSCHHTSPNPGHPKIRPQYPNFQQLM